MQFWRKSSKIHDCFFSILIKLLSRMLTQKLKLKRSGFFIHSFSLNYQIFFFRKVEDFDELDDVGVSDEIEDCDFALDHVLLAGALRLVDDLQRERLPTALAHALVHHREVPFDLKLSV